MTTLLFVRRALAGAALCSTLLLAACTGMDATSLPDLLATPIPGATTAATPSALAGGPPPTSTAVVAPRLPTSTAVVAPALPTSTAVVAPALPTSTAVVEAVPPTSTNVPTAPPATVTAVAPAATPAMARAWTRTGMNPAGNLVLVGAPGAPKTVYGGDDNGFYRSLDGGQRWTQLSGRFKVSQIAVAPSNPQVIYAGTGTGCYSGFTGHLYKSTDGGVTWAEVTGGPYQLDINPTNPLHLLGLDCSQVVKSIDGGQTWTPVPGSGVTNFDPSILARGVNNRSVIYVVSASEGGSIRIARTTNDARTWQILADETLYGPHALVVDPLDARHLYLVAGSGFYASANSGDTWNRLSAGLEATHAPSGQFLQLTNLVLDRVSQPPAGAAATLYLGSYGAEGQSPGGLFRWNGNNAWVPVLAAPDGQSMSNLLMVNDPDGPALLASTATGLYRLPLTGASGQVPPPVSNTPSWQPTNWSAVNLLTLTGSPAQPATVYAGQQTGISRSTDGGRTWVSLAANFTAAQIAVAPSNPQVLYAGTATGCASGDPGALYRSSDGGQTWATRSAGPRSLDINPTNPDQLVGLQCDGVYKSTDGGQTWGKLPGTGVTNYEGASLTRGTNNRTIIYAAYNSEGGTLAIQRTTDDGRTWQTLTTPNFRNLTTLTVDPQNAKRVYFVGYSGVYTSNDAGDTWVEQNQGLEQAGGEAEDPAAYPLSNLAPGWTTASDGAPRLYIANIVFEGRRSIYKWNGKDMWAYFTSDPTGGFPLRLYVVNDPAFPALLVGTEDALFRLPLR